MTKLRFRYNFDFFVFAGDEIDTRNGNWSATCEVMEDSDREIDDDDTHSTDRKVTGASSKQHRKLMEAREAFDKCQWFYGGLRVTVSKHNIELGECEIWDVKVNYPGSGNDHLLEVANRALQHALDKAQLNLTKLIEA